MGSSRHAVIGATASRVRQALAVVFATGALAAAGGISAAAYASPPDGLIDGRHRVDQNGEQNLNCGNTAPHLVRIIAFDKMRAKKTCTDTDGHTRHHGRQLGARAVSGTTTLAPQVNTAQAGKQNLNCGNTADTVTLNIASTVERQTTCKAIDRTHRRGTGHDAGRGKHPGNAQAAGGTSAAGQTNTAQTGKQNLHCGNATGAATVSVLGTMRQRTTCLAVDDTRRKHDADKHRGKATARSAQPIGPATNTAQNGRQNNTCGQQTDIQLSVPLEQPQRNTQCTAHDHS